MARRPALPAGRAVGGGQSAVAAAQRKHASSRAQATTVTLCGLPRPRMRSIDAVQPVLGAVSDLQDVIGLALLAVFEGHPDPWGASVVPGGLDEQPASEPDPVFVIEPWWEDSPDW